MKMSEFEVGVWYTNPQLDKTYGAFDGGCGRDWAASVDDMGMFMWGSTSQTRERQPFKVSKSDITRDDWEPVWQPKEDLCAGESHMFVGVRCTGCGKEYASAIGNTIRSCPCGELYFTLFNHPKPDPCDEAWEKEWRKYLPPSAMNNPGDIEAQTAGKWFRRGFNAGRESK